MRGAGEQESWAGGLEEEKREGLCARCLHAAEQGEEGQEKDTGGQVRGKGHGQVVGAAAIPYPRSYGGDALHLVMAEEMAP